MIALFAIFLFGSVPAAAQGAGGQLCQMAGAGSGCIDYGVRGGWRAEPSRPAIDPEESAAARARRWEQLQDSLAHMEHPQAEPPTPVDVPTIVREDVDSKMTALRADSRALVLGLAATELGEALEIGLLVEAFIAAAPEILVTAAVVEAARRMGWIFAKTRKPPADAHDPNGAKAPGKPGDAEGFEEPKGGEAWGKAPNGDWGWVDADGDIWVPTGPPGPGSTAHGGPHWDVQLRNGGYRNGLPGKRLVK